MEKTLNMGAFEALDNREMMEVDGGVAGAVVFAWACLTYIALPAIGYVGEKLYEEGKRGYEDGKASVRK